MNRPIDTLKQAIKDIRVSLSSKQISQEQADVLTQDAFLAYRRTITNREAA